MSVRTARLDASLATRDAQGRIALHDLQLDYVRNRSRDGLLAAHKQLLDAYVERYPQDWPAINDEYFLQGVTYHMAATRDGVPWASCCSTPRSFVRSSTPSPMSTCSKISAGESSASRRPTNLRARDSHTSNCTRLACAISSTEWRRRRSSKSGFDWIRHPVPSGRILS